MERDMLDRHLESHLSRRRVMKTGVKLAYAYEQAANARRPPPGLPPL